jgi:hypothetical protein
MTCNRIWVIADLAISRIACHLSTECFFVVFSSGTLFGLWEILSRYHSRKFCRSCNYLVTSRDDKLIRNKRTPRRHFSACRWIESKWHYEALDYFCLDFVKNIDNQPQTIKGEGRSVGDFFRALYSEFLPWVYLPHLFGFQLIPVRKSQFCSVRMKFSRVSYVTLKSSRFQPRDIQWGLSKAQFWDLPQPPDQVKPWQFVLGVKSIALFSLPLQPSSPIDMWYKKPDILPFLSLTTPTKTFHSSHNANQPFVSHNLLRPIDHTISDHLSIQPLNVDSLSSLFLDH